MDEGLLSAELVELRGELERLRLDLAQATSLRRQLDAAQQQLRRSRESIERRDTILREAKRQIAKLSRDVENARLMTEAAKDALEHGMGSRWSALRPAARRAGKRPWRWLAVPFKVLAHRRPPQREKIAPQSVESWQPSPAVPSRPTIPRAPRSLRVAAIASSALLDAFAPECSLITFGPGTVVPSLEDAIPHLLLVESDLYGNDGGWQGLLQAEEDSGALSDLRAAVDWCRARQVATVFWNTQDPAGMDRWLPVASMFDHVLTVDADSVARYAGRGPLGHANLAELPAGVQPRTFGPDSAGRSARACFVVTADHTVDARAWAETDALVRAVRPIGLDVFVMPDVVVPQGLAGAQPLLEPLESLYRRYAVALSAPAANDAKGKLPRRVLEMLASGVAVVALATPDVSLNLGSVVTTVGSAGAAPDVVQGLLDDDVRRARVMRQGVTFVLREHTVTHRLAAIAEAVGLAVDAEADRRFTALVLADQAADAGVALRWLAGQSRSPDAIVIGTKSRAADIEQGLDSSDARIRVVRQGGESRSGRFAELARMSSTPWVFAMSSQLSDNELLESLILRAPYVHADVVGLASGGQRSTQYSGEVDVNAAVARAGLVAQSGWPDDVETIRRWSLEGRRVFALDAAPFF